MSSTKVFFATISIILLSFASRTQTSVPRIIGSNISDVEDYSTELIFSNIFKQSREWIPYELFGAWDSGVNVPLGPNGYPLEIPYNDGVNPPQQLKTLIFTDINPYFPGGDYRLIIGGTGQITLSGAVNSTITCPFDGIVNVDNTQNGILLEIEVSNVTDPINSIELILPGHELTYSTDPFNSDFLDFLDDFGTIRFMDFMKTNNSSVVDWSDRTSVSNYTQTSSEGAAYEYLIELCNQTQSDAWVCIPHRATDNFITEFATLLQDSLDPGLKIYVEYSNEVWNGIFDQSLYAENMAVSLGYTGQPWEQGWKYYAKRSADVHQIFENVFTNDDQIINVVASQMVGYVADYILGRYSETTYNPTMVQAEALAIAPYFGGSLADHLGDIGLIPTATVNDILDSLEFNSLPQSFLEMAELNVVATDHSLDFIAYEGGQHLVSYGYNNNAAYVDTLIAVNRHPRMENLYCQYFNHWYETIDGGLFCNFSSHGASSIYGSWGVKEYMADTLAPKYLGMQNCVFSYNSSIGLEENEVAPELIIYPQPSIDGTITIDHDLISPTIFMNDMLGRSIDFQILEISDQSITLNINNFSGVGIISFSGNDYYFTKTIVVTH